MDGTTDSSLAKMNGGKKRREQKSCLKSEEAGGGEEPPRIRVFRRKSGSPSRNDTERTLSMAVI